MNFKLHTAACFAAFFFFFIEKNPVSAQNTGILITRQPADQTICPGINEAVFSVEARSGSDSPIEFQWFVSTDGGQDFTAAPSGTTASFTIPASVFAIFPKLKIKAQLAAKGCKNVETLVANLVSEGATRLAVFPKNETTVAGGNVIFEAKIESEAGEKANFTYQWQRSRYGTGVFEDLAGEVNHMVWLKKITADFNGSLFRVIIRGGGICDKMVSQPVSIFVENAPLVSLSPAEKTVCEHGTASFGVLIKNGTGREKFRWQVSRDDGKTFSNLPGETGKTFSASDLTSDLSGSQFRAVVEGPGGLEFITNAGRVLVNGTISIAQQPANYLACPGDSAIFQLKLRSSGTAGASYQWQTSRDGGSKWLDIPKKNGETMSVYVDNDNLNGHLFRAQITAGDCGEISSETARLDVVKTVTFSQNNQYSVVAGKTAEIRTQPTPSPGTFLGQWQLSTDGGQTWSGIRDADSPILTIPNTVSSMSGRLFRYKSFSKECGRIFFSEPILLKVE